MPESPPTLELAGLATAREVEIETSSPEGEIHRTIIWIVVVDGEAYIRSYRGPGARWYREARSGRSVRLHVDDTWVDVSVEATPEAAIIAAVSAAFERKYAGDPSTAAMVRAEVRSTTLRLRTA